MENLLPDQFLFVNKTAKSKSLSHSRPEERFNIHSHVHSKHHKAKNSRKRSHTLPKSPGTQPLKAAEDHVPERGRTLKIQKVEFMTLQSSLTRQPAVTEPDPFNCATVKIDKREHRLLQYPFSSFVRISFPAEAMDLEPESVSYKNFRHRQAINDRLQRCVADQLTLFSTLAYCANCLQWAVGERAIPNRPAEYYTLKAIEVLKERLAMPDPEPDSWLILSIYSLSVSDMWAGNYAASTSHMGIIRHFVCQVGGWKHLTPYLMESLVLGDKYLAIGKFAPPVLPFDWDPGRYSESKWIDLTANVDFGTLGIAKLASGFLQLQQDTLCLELKIIVADIVEAVQVAHCLDSSRRTLDPNSEHWLFLRHQAFVSRLLMMPAKSGSIQECCRIALLVWLLKVTAYFGAARRAKEQLPRLKATLAQLDDEELQAEPEAKLIFWIECLGAMTAEYTAERDWFLGRVVQSAVLLGIQLEKPEVWRVLEQYFLLKSEGGLQFARMVRAARGLKAESSCSDN
ncbi:MAG: hypothetical protein Q9191_001025 [Dirinaria sp. TL-2023a]